MELSSKAANIHLEDNPDQAEKKSRNIPEELPH
jgi:hypothetical protein